MAGAMGAGTFSFVVFAVLATELIEEFNLDRWQIGALVSSTALAGAIASPRVGYFVDQIGGRASIVITLLGSAVGLFALASATGFLWLVIAAMVGGVVQAFANPATNKLVAQHVGHGYRGFVIGLKQSGVQFGVFIGGMSLPGIAQASSWRWAVAVFAGITLVTGIASLAIVPSDVPLGTDARGTRARLPFLSGSSQLSEPSQAPPVRQ